MLEVPHFSEHKSRAIGTQTPSHFLCQEKTHQDAYWKSVGPSGSFGCPSHKKNKSLSFSASLDSLARSHLLLTDKPLHKSQHHHPKKGRHHNALPPSSLLPSFTRGANTYVLHSRVIIKRYVEKSTYESIIK